MKSKILLIFLVLNNFTYSQNIIKTIPIIQYNPTEYTTSIEKEFRTPRNYLQVVKKGNETIYYVDYDSGKKEMTKDKVLQNKIPEKITNNKDSIFILHLYSNEKYDFKYYGIIKDNTTFLYRYNDVQPYSLYSLIEKEFSSIDKFKQILLDDFINSLEYGENNGLHPMNKNSAIQFLKQDYSFYESYKPNDKINITKLFMTFLKKSIPLKESQQKAIESSLQKALPPLPQEQQNMLYYNPNHKIELLGSNYSFIMALNLSEEQYKNLVRQVNAQNKIRKKYIQYLIKNTTEIHYHNGERIFLSENEEEKVLAEIIFNL